MNMTQKFMLPWQQICRMYPIKAHVFFFKYILFTLQFYFVFHHFVLDDNLERKKKKKKKKKKKSYPLGKNCVAMETKLFHLLKQYVVLTDFKIIWLVLMR